MDSSVNIRRGMSSWVVRRGEKQRHTASSGLPDGTGNPSVMCLCWTSLQKALVRTTVTFGARRLTNAITATQWYHEAVKEAGIKISHYAMQPSCSEQDGLLL